VMFLTLKSGLNAAVRSGNVKLWLTIGMLLFVVMTLLMREVEHDNIAVALLASCALGLHGSIYWLARHVVVSRLSTFELIGAQMGRFQTIQIVMSAAGPMVAGVLAQNYGFSSGFLAACAAALISLVPLWLTPMPSGLESFAIEHPVRVLRGPRAKLLAPVYFLEGVSEMFFTTAWSLAFFIFIGSALNLGVMLGLSAFFSAVLIMLIGKGFDRGDRVTALRKTTRLRMISIGLYAPLYFVPLASVALLVDTLHRFADAMHATVRTAYLFALSTRVHPSHFHFIRESWLNLGRVVSALMLALIFIVAPPAALWFTIGIAAITQIAWINLVKLDHLLHPPPHPANSHVDEEFQIEVARLCVVDEVHP